MTSLQKAMLRKWKVDRMASWQNGKLTNGYLTKSTLTKCQVN